MAVPPACVPIAGDVAALEHQYAALSLAVSNSTGDQAWRALAQLGALRAQLVDANAALSQCVRAYGAALTGTVVVFDESGLPPAGGHTAALWDLGGTGPMAQQVADVQSGAFGFHTPFPANPAISLQAVGASDADLLGVDFRSDPLATPLADQMRIELVLAPQIQLTVGELRAWAAGVSTPVQPVASGVPIQASVTSVALSLTPGLITLTATGTVAATVAGAVLAGPVPVAVTTTLSLLPVAFPPASSVVTATLTGPNPTTISGGGILVGAAQAYAPFVMTFVSNILQRHLTDWLNSYLPGFVANALALPQLPTGVTLSLRRLTIDVNGITLQPVLGAFGTTLSTYQPVPLPAPG